MTIEDIDFFNEVRNLSTNFLHDKTKYSIEDNISWFKSTNPTYFIATDDGEKIGYIRTSNWKTDSVYVGMDIHPKYRGLGYANNLYELLFEKLKTEYKLSKVYLEVLTSNKRAINIYNKLNFTIIDLLYYDGKDKSIKMEKYL